MGCSAGGQGLPLGSGDGGRGAGAGREDTVAPGYREHPPRSDLVRAERGNPVEVRVRPVSRPQGRPNSCAAGTDGQEANAGWPKGHRKPGHQGCFLQQPPRRTGRIRAYARPERELT
jgi:hypothetical protein